MPKRKANRRAGHPLPYTDKALLSHAAALGQLALAWNGLHEMMAFLFCSVMGAGVSNQYLAIWHSIKSDRAQRDLLTAAVQSDPRGAYPMGYVEDITWLCRQATSLEDARNDALHSPIWAYQDAPDRVTVRPVIGLGHVRAKKLFDKGDLLSQFRWCRDTAIVLAEYALAMDASLSSDHMKTWPDRPELPNRGQTSAKKPPRQVRKAIPVRQP